MSSSSKNNRNKQFTQSSLAASTSSRACEDALVNIYHKVKTNFAYTGDTDTCLAALDGAISKYENDVTLKTTRNFARLHTLRSDIKLSGAKLSSDLVEVRLSAENSLSILLSASPSNKELVSSITSAALYQAVAIKATGDIDESFVTLNKAIDILIKYYHAAPSQYIMLSRQFVLMTQEEAQFAKLLDGVAGYLDKDTAEAYASVKRVFEFCLNRKLQKQAKKLFSLFNETFRICSPKLPILAKISYQKNIGQYYLLLGDQTRAIKILRQAYSFATSLGYFGQQVQIESLISEGCDSDSAVLKTFNLPRVKN